MEKEEKKVQNLDMLDLKNKKRMKKVLTKGGYYHHVTL